MAKWIQDPHIPPDISPLTPLGNTPVKGASCRHPLYSGDGRGTEQPTTTAEEEQCWPACWGHTAAAFLCPPHTQFTSQDSFFTDPWKVFKDNLHIICFGKLPMFANSAVNYPFFKSLLSFAPVISQLFHLWTAYKEEVYWKTEVSKTEFWTWSSNVEASL